MGREYVILVVLLILFSLATLGYYQFHGINSKALGTDLFDPSSVKSTTVDGDTTVSTDRNGNKQTTTTNPDGSTSTQTTDKNGKTTSDSRDIAKHILTDPQTYETLAAGLVYALLLEAAKNVEKEGLEKGLSKTAEDLAKGARSAGKLAVKGAEQIGELAARLVGRISRVVMRGCRTLSEFAVKSLTNIGIKTAEKTAENVAERVGEKAAERTGEKAAEIAGEKVATKLATQATVSLAAGPEGAPFVEAAEIVFQMFTGVMDELNLGGFKDATNMKSLNSMRDTVNEQILKGFEKANVPLPVNYGPEDAAPDIKVVMADIGHGVKALALQKIADVQAGWKNGSLPKLPAGSTPDDYVNYFNAHIDYEALWNQSEAAWCTAHDGTMKKHPKTGNLVCTYTTTSKCTAPWPTPKNGQYYELDRKLGMCVIRASEMRTQCEGMGYGITYNMDTGSCNLTQAYCGRYGADNGLRNGDCSFSKSEQIAETLFGTAFVRGIVNVFGMNNYAPCPPGSTEPVELAVAFRAEGGSLWAKYLCRSDKCPDGQQKISGLCYDICKKATDAEKAQGYSDYNDKSDALGSTVQGMCYRCPPGYRKTTAGLCQAPDPVTDFTGADSKCPDGWSETTAGMCSKQCDTFDGTRRYKNYLGICYHPDVDTKLLVKVPKLGKCDHGGKDIGLICSVPVKCHTDGCPGKWGAKCCKVCKPPKTTCSGDHSYPKKQICPKGYKLVAGMCYAISHPGIQPSRSKIEIGVCGTADDKNADGSWKPGTRTDKQAGRCYKRCDDPSWGGSKYLKRTLGGICMSPKPTVIADQYSRPPKGTSYRVFPRKRTAPFATTSDQDFKNSDLGRHVQDGINSIRDGNIEGLGVAMAGMALVTNTIVVATGTSSLANMAIDSAGKAAGVSTGAPRSLGTGGE